MKNTGLQKTGQEPSALSFRLSAPYLAALLILFPGLLFGDNAVTSIRVRPITTPPYSARISWKIAPADGSSSLYVGRSDRPILDMNRLRESKNLTPAPLPPGTTEFVDPDLPNGVYYYIILSGAELSGKRPLVLKADANYTIRPFIVSRISTQEKEESETSNEEARMGKVKDGLEEKEKEKSKAQEARKEETAGKEQTPPAGPTAAESATESARKEAPERGAADRERHLVHNLVAVGSESSVKLNWAPAAASDVDYLIYRSDRPLNTPAAVSRATLLGTVPEETLRFEDNGPIAEQEVYYGVVVKSRTLSKEFDALEYGSSYISFTYRPPAAGRLKEERLPSALQSRVSGRDSVEITWRNPESKSPLNGYHIYRAMDPIYGTTKLQDAEYLGVVPPRTKSYTDRGLAPGRYFYALIPLDDSRQEIADFREGETFTGFAAVIQPSALRTEANRQATQEAEEEKQNLPQEAPSILYLKADTEEQMVHLFWDTDRQASRDFQFVIYRSNGPLRNRYELNQNGILIQELPATSRDFIDRNLEPGQYSYAVLLEKKGSMADKMVEGRNFLKFPVRITTPEAERRREEQEKASREAAEKEATKEKEKTRDAAKAEAARIEAQQKASAAAAEKAKEQSRATETETPPERATPDELLLPANKEAPDVSDEAGRDEETSRGEESTEETTAPESREPVPSKAQESEERLLSVLRNHYTKRDYAGTVEGLAPLTLDEHLPEEIRAKALFYTALSYYNMHDYRSASRLLLEPLVRKHFQERALFWYGRSVERIR